EDASALVARASADAWARLVHGEAWLATLAVRLGWTPAALANHHDAITRFPDTEIRPSAPPLAEALDALAKATKATCACWDPAEVLALLEGLVWTAKASFDPERLAEVVAR